LSRPISSLEAFRFGRSAPDLDPRGDIRGFESVAPAHDAPRPAPWFPGQASGALEGLKLAWCAWPARPAVQIPNFRHCSRVDQASGPVGVVHPVFVPHGNDAAGSVMVIVPVARAPPPATRPATWKLTADIGKYALYPKCPVLATALWASVSGPRRIRCRTARHPGAGEGIFSIAIEIT